MKRYIPNIIICIGLLGFGCFLSAKTIADTPVIHVCFTPGEDCTAEIVEQINDAKRSIYVQSYSFTSLPIANALVAAEKRLNNVNMIFDKGQFKNKRSLVPMILATDTMVYKDDKVAIAHNKVMIIDDHIVITGSFNFTKAAQERNAENLLIIDDKDLATKYRSNWNKRKQASIWMGGNY